MSDEYDEIDIDLRSAETISRRLTVLLAIGRRYDLEFEIANVHGQEEYAAETDRFDLYSWIRSTMPGQVTEPELAFLRTPAGRATSRQLDRHAFDSDSAIALGWVLGLVPALTVVPGSQLSADHLRGIAPSPWDSPDAFKESITMRDELIVWEERERLYLVRLRGLLDDVTDPVERREAIEDVLVDAELAEIPTHNKDILVGSSRFADLDVDTKSIALTLTDAYLHALTWACGFGASWEDVPIDDL
jgi:hypothetical protein